MPRKRRYGIPASIEWRYFVMSHNADRSIRGIGLCKKGIWVEVPKTLYGLFKRDIANGKASGEDIGWKVRREILRLEV